MHAPFNVMFHVQSARLLERTRPHGRPPQIEKEGDHPVQSGRTIERDTSNAIQLLDIDVTDR